MIYLDNAATTFPKPSQVTKAIFNNLKNFAANPGRSGHKLSLMAAADVFKCREKLAEFFNAAGPENVVFTLNCTHSINTVLKGILKPGDNVIISCLEHNALTRPLKALERQGITTSVAKIFVGDEQKTLNSFKEKIMPNTALIACLHASNVFGIRLPIEKIAEMAHSRHIPFLLDAAQSAGILPIDVQKMNIDYLCAPGHKGLYGPMGTGILITKLYQDLSPLMYGGTGTNSILQEQPETMPEKYESGTQNTPGISGLIEGINFLKIINMENIAMHEYELVNQLYEDLANINKVRLYMPKPAKQDFVPLISFNIEEKDSETVANLLNENNIAVRAGLHCAPSAHSFVGTEKGGTVRVCPSYFNNKVEMKMFANVINKIVQNKKI